MTKFSFKTTSELLQLFELEITQENINRENLYNIFLELILYHSDEFKIETVLQPYSDILLKLIKSLKTSSSIKDKILFLFIKNRIDTFSLQEPLVQELLDIENTSEDGFASLFACAFMINKMSIVNQDLIHLKLLDSYIKLEKHFYITLPLLVKFYSKAVGSFAFLDYTVQRFKLGSSVIDFLKNNIDKIAIYPYLLTTTQFLCQIMPALITDECDKKFYRMLYHSIENKHIISDINLLTNTQKNLVKKINKSIEFHIRNKSKEFLLFLKFSIEIEDKDLCNLNNLAYIILNQYIRREISLEYFRDNEILIPLAAKLEKSGIINLRIFSALLFELSQPQKSRIISELQFQLKQKNLPHYIEYIFNSEMHNSLFPSFIWGSRYSYSAENSSISHENLLNAHYYFLLSFDLAKKDEINYPYIESILFSIYSNKNFLQEFSFFNEQFTKRFNISISNYVVQKIKYILSQDVIDKEKIKTLCTIMVNIHTLDFQNLEANLYANLLDLMNGELDENNIFKIIPKNKFIDQLEILKLLFSKITSIFPDKIEIAIRGQIFNIQVLAQNLLKALDKETQQTRSETSNYISNSSLGSIKPDSSPEYGVTEYVLPKTINL